MTELDRRHALGLAAAAVVGAPLLAACGSGSGDAGSGDAATPAGPLAKTSDIPEGEGKIFGDAKVVVTQPSSGEFKCFTAVCTHQACIVSSVSDGEIHCGCHGSAFSIQDGSVKNGPASSPLAEKKITVSGGEITLA